MAKCPECGKIWFCKFPDDLLSHFNDEEDEEFYPHCNKCKCPDCRKPGDRMTIEEEYYGKRKEKTEAWYNLKHFIPATWIGDWYRDN